MPNSPYQTLRARFIVPVSRPLIANGAVVIADGRIATVGHWREIATHTTGPVWDAGDTALLPGFVNAHCHLDYTDMAGQIAPLPSFTDWIKSITTHKSGWSRAEFVASWCHGAEMLLTGGVTTVGDIEAAPDLLPEMWNATPLRVTSFLELTGVRSRIDPSVILNDALARADALRHPRCRAALSPHAPYSTVPALLKWTAEGAATRGWPISVHVAESDEEFDMFRAAQGPMYEWIARNQRDMNDCGGVTPVGHLERCGLLGPALLAIHANYLEGPDLAKLAGAGASIVHCPRSHAYFGHRPFPFPSVQRAGVNVCLGTDSLATTLRPPFGEFRLDLLAEARAFLGTQPATPPEQLLRMLTVNGAHALGLAGQVGEFSPGAHADLQVFPHAGSADTVIDALMHHQEGLPAIMIGGNWVRGAISSERI